MRELPRGTIEEGFYLWFNFEEKEEYYATPLYLYNVNRKSGAVGTGTALWPKTCRRQPWFVNVLLLQATCNSPLLQASYFFISCIIAYTRISKIENTIRYSISQSPPSRVVPTSVQKSPPLSPPLGLRGQKASPIYRLALSSR